MASTPPTTHAPIDSALTDEHAHQEEKNYPTGAVALAPEPKAASVPHVSEEVDGGDNDGDDSAAAVHASMHGLLYDGGASTSWSAPKLAANSNETARPGYSNESASEYLDRQKTLQAKVSAVAALMKRSKRTVIYTGAGISTASGIADYASKARKSVAPHLRGTDGKTPKSALGSGSRLCAAPTVAHQAIAALEKAGRVQHWLQQNHDRLAQKAGFPQEKLNEIHGAWGDDYNPVVMMDGDLRPDMDRWLEQWEAGADLVLAVGTSLCGMYADCVAEACARKYPNRHLVIVNLQPTPMDSVCSVRVWALLDDFFVALAKQLGIKRIPDPVCKARGDEWTRSHPGCMYRTPKRGASAPM
jgi:NAD-dependent SIR2 family protein deacetylase